MKVTILNNKLTLLGIMLVSIIFSLTLNCYVTGVNNQVIHPIWLIAHSSKKWILGWLIIFFFLGCLLKFTKFPDYLHKYRYLIGCGILVLCVLFNINGSSIGEWMNVINDGSLPDNGNLIGISRSIRGDEWNVFTSLALSQEYNNYNYISEIPRAAPTDMFMIYGQPVNDISMIFRPFQIGYLFLGSSYGLSFYWMSRLIFLFLFSYEFMLLITKKQRLISVVGAIMITFAPAIQWWFSTNGYIEMIIAIEVSVMLFNKYMLCNKLWVRMLCSAGIMVCAGMYALTLYPPVLIPLAYVLLGLIAWVFFKNFKSCKYCWRDFLCTLGVVFIFGLLLARVFIMSFDTIMAVINTSYPGQREYIGGGLDISSYTDSIFNILLPFNNNFVLGNYCEDARFIDLFPLSYLLVIAILLVRRKNEKLSLLIKILLPINIFLMIISILPMPSILMNITLLSKASTRIMFAVQFSNIIIMIKAISQLYTMKKKSYKWTTAVIIIIALVWTAIVFVLRRDNILALNKSYIDVKSWIIICSIIFGMLIVLGLLSIKHPKFRALWSTSIIVIVLIAGGLVNPVRSGIDVVREQNLSKAIQSISDEDKDAKWMFNGCLGSNYLIANGANTINSINVYPCLERWQTIDKNNTFYEIYNRYAHIQTNYCPRGSSQNKFQLKQPDNFLLNYNKDDLNNLNVKYILSPISTSSEFLADKSFKIIYQDRQFYILEIQK